MYLENDDLCLRVKRKEKIYVCGQSLISHLGQKLLMKITVRKLIIEKLALELVKILF